ncbi:ubiquitin specific peptidase echinus isoform X2 [Oratosquilla oratoria]|uniref:ubiquitin specific peptidase echinus isoform X2 n=1 Tax=Oratosquilla oratoria TaxID=337810 RepID=UPI003F758700
MKSDKVGKRLAVFQVFRVLWHLDIFRRSFRELNGHACLADACIFCALKELFSQLQYSHESALPPDALRRALAETFYNQQRFQLGFMDDAAECFENILLRIHFHIASGESEDMCNARHCIPHQRFAMTLVEQSMCDACGATSEPLPFNQMVHYVSASALIAQARQHSQQQDGSQPQTSRSFPEMFGNLLKKAGGMGDIRDCPSACGAKIQICRTLINRPEIVSIGVVWDSERPTLEHIMAVFAIVGTNLKLRDVFHSVVDDRWAQMTNHQLVGVVTYYGKHYSTFFFHTKLRVWIYFDDATVREIGPHWDQVVEKCRRGHFQPLLLLYANPNGTSVPIETAPKTVTQVAGHKAGGNHERSSGVSQVPQYGSLPRQSSRRSTTPNPDKNTADIRANSRRAITPNPDGQHSQQQGTRANNSNTHEDHRDYQNISALQHLYTDNGDTHSDDVFENNSSNFKKQVENLKQTNGILPNKPSILPRGRLDSDDSLYISRRTVESVMHYHKSERQRSVSCSGGYNNVNGNRNSSSSLEQFDKDPLKLPDLANAQPRRRDSGNWSGDRNSASSSSSTSLENPYHFLVGKGRHPSSPTTKNPPASPQRKDHPEYANLGIGVNSNFMQNGQSSHAGQGGQYDPGYDSYSLSSNDSYPIQQNLKHNLQLQQIPEGVQAGTVEGDVNKSITNGELNTTTGSTMSNKSSPSVLGPPMPEGNPECASNCEALCIAADRLLEDARTKEESGDLQTALNFCNAAAAKTRAAMDAPYNSTHSLTFARMKHNTCVLRGRSLQRRILIHEEAAAWEGQYKIEGPHHSRQGSRDSQRSRNSRQGSREGSAYHSRQGSRDASNGSQSRPVETLDTAQTLAKTAEKLQNTNIEIYATLPKKKGKKLTTTEKISKTEDITENFQEKREKKSSSDKNKEKKGVEKVSKDKNKEKKSSKGRLEDSDYASDHSNKKSPSKKSTEDDHNAIVEVKDEKPVGKKQHKVRRKLLMGGLIRRKNRSMPDLREGQDGETAKARDDLEVRSLSRPTTPSDKSMAGYLSEGHLEYSNPNLERSKLMRKSFHGSVGKGLAPAKANVKVPPPIPQRTTSQLSTKNEKNKKEDTKRRPEKRPPYPLPNERKTEEPDEPPALPPRCYTPEIVNNNNNHNIIKTEPQSLQYMQQHYMYQTSSLPYNTTAVLQELPKQIIIHADVHREQHTPRDKCSALQPSTAHKKTVSETQFQMGGSVQNPPGGFEPPPAPVSTLPPWPQGDVAHSRQNSEDFPPPPPPLEEAVEDLKTRGLLPTPPPMPSMFPHTGDSAQDPNILLALMQQKKQLLESQEVTEVPSDSRAKVTSGGTSGNSWLQELQAKQAAMKRRKETPGAANNAASSGEINGSDGATNSANRSVRDLASHFENVTVGGPKDTDEVDSRPVAPTSSAEPASQTANPYLYSAVQSSSSGDASYSVDSSQHHVQPHVQSQPQVQQHHLSQSHPQTLPPSQLQQTQSQNLQPPPPQQHPQTYQAQSQLQSHPQPTEMQQQQPQPQSQPPSVQPQQPLSKELFTREYTQCNSLQFPSLSGYESRLSANNASVHRTRSDHNLASSASGAGNGHSSENNREDSELNTSTDTSSSENSKKKKAKKSVTFCDQVVLVATAEDEEEESYIPNPILERVLKSALTNPKNSNESSSGADTSSEPPSPRQPPSSYSQEPPQSVHTSSSAPSNPSPYQPVPQHQSQSHMMQGSSHPYPSTVQPHGARQPYTYPSHPHASHSSHQPQPSPRPPHHNLHTVQSNHPSSYHNAQTHPPAHHNTQGHPTQPHPSHRYQGNPSQGHPSQSQPSQSQTQQVRMPPPYQPPPSVQQYPRPTSQPHQLPPHTVRQQQQQPPQQQQARQQPHLHPTHHHHPHSHPQQQQMNGHTHPYYPGLMTRQNSSLGYEANFPTSRAAGTEGAKPPYQKVPHPHHQQQQQRGYQNSQNHHNLQNGHTSTHVPYPQQQQQQQQHPATNHQQQKQQQQQQGPNYGSVGRGSNPQQQQQKQHLGPNHIQGPIDPTAIYTTVNKAAKKGTTSSNPAVNQTKGALQPCNLCRKKAVHHSSIYCQDCDFYMARFKPEA